MTSDISDMASIQEEHILQSAINLHNTRVNNSEKIHATGYCLYCENDLDDGKRWCDVECRDAWQKLNPGK